MSEFKIPAALADNGRVKTVTAFDNRVGGGVYTADNFHPHWEAILKALRDGDYGVFDLFNIGSGAAKRFEKITDRVSWNGSDVLWDGAPLHSMLSAQLKRAIVDGHEDNYLALAKFWEKLESNPNEHSRQQAYDWLASHEFKITPEGDVVGYKGVNKSYDAADGAEVYHSVHSSSLEDKPSGFVNGTPIEPLSRIPQTVGDVVTMPREEVKHDPSVSCHRGLHIGTYHFASSYGDTMFEVHFNPRDIVSVPTGDRGKKVRVCEYTVARVVTQEATGSAPVLRNDEPKVTSWIPDVGYRQ